MPSTIPYPQTNRMSPESMVGDYQQQGLQDIQDRYMQQWNEISKRGSVLGARRQTEMFDELDSRFGQQALKFKQGTAQQMQQFSQLDQLAEQGGFDPYEAKMRMVLGPEAEAAMYPRQEAQRSVEAQYNELDVHRKKLEGRLESYLTIPGGRIPQWWKLEAFEKRTGKTTKIFDPDLNPRYDKKEEVWMAGGHRDMTYLERRERTLLLEARKDIMRQQQELLDQPDVATRVRGAMFRTKREPKTDSLVTQVQESAGMVAPKPQAPREQKPERQAIVPTADQLIKLNTEQAYDEGVRLGYWE